MDRYHCSDTEHVDESAVRDDDVSFWRATGGAKFIEPVDNVFARDDLPEDYVFPVEMGSLLERDKELRAVGISACVSH